MALDVSVDVLEDESIPSPGSAAVVPSIVRHALAMEGRFGNWDVAVAMMSDAGLRRLHRDFMGLNTLTDIMTFPRGDGQFGGDIAISVERAAAQGPEHGLSAWQEVCFLVVHGVLHLCGWDDGDDVSRAAMLARQATILHQWDESQAAPSER